jgi:hypothetical protein
LRRIKLILAAATAMATLLVVTASPAMARTFDGNHFHHFNGDIGSVHQGFSIRNVRSGAASPRTVITNSGNNVNLCTPVQQVANTGNVLNQQGVVQDSNGFSHNGFTRDGFGFFPRDNFGFGGGDIDFEGSSINIAPALSSDCNQAINQVGTW